MRIGIMMRAYDEHGGIGVYTRNIVRELLELDHENRYVLFYRNPASIGAFAAYANVDEVVVRAPNKAIWDQIMIPLACRREQVDVLFHPKFTAPLFAPCKVVMVVHGADWFIPEQAKYYHPLDVFYLRVMMPRYFKKCSTVISVSELTTENYRQVFRLPEGKVRTVYFAPARFFKPETDPERLRAARETYGLPEKFILTLTKRSGGDRRKNLGNIFSAYARYHRSVEAPHALVVGGKDAHLFRQEYGLPADGYGRDVYFPGWIEQKDLPAIYSLADLYLYPSNLEAFPIPITEALACGTPIVTSNANGLEEIAGDAAVLVDPEDAQAIAGAIGAVLGDTERMKKLSTKGLARSERFSWDRCARETLRILENAAA